MSGPGDPPEGTPEGASGGGEDEFRSVVFDESFVRAARIQEFSARERQDEAGRAVRVRHALPGGLARQAVALVLLIVLAFSFAVYMGVRHPYHAHDPASGTELQVTVTPLVPDGPVRAVSPDAPFAGTPAARPDFHSREKGLALPQDVEAVGDFDVDDVTAGYEIVRSFLDDSGLQEQTVTGGDTRAVQKLLEPEQLDLFNGSLSAPVADGVHEATGWLVRFDPDPGDRVELATDDIRVRGTYSADLTTDGRLEVVADHTYVYAIRDAADPDGPVSLFTVRRRMAFHFTHGQLREHRLEVVRSDVTAGPLACAAEVQSYFLPILAGHSAPDTVSGVNPYETAAPPGARCAPLTGVDPTEGTGAAANPGTTAPSATAPAVLDTVTATAAGSPAARPQDQDRIPVSPSPLLTPAGVPRSPASRSL
ncbi:SCO2583 family membrane protein [Streptomyces sp. NPDC004031]